MGFRVSLALVGLHHVLSLIREGNRSGVLSVDTGDDEARFFFRYGEMVHGTRSKESGSIFDFLIEQSIVNPAELSASSESDGKINLSILVRNLGTDRKLEVAAALQARAKINLYQMLTREQGELSFLDREVDHDDNSRIQQEREGIERLADQDLDRLILFKRLVPHLGMVFVINTEEIEDLKQSLTRTEKTILRSFSGSRSLAEILPTLEGEELYTVFTVVSLIESGALREATVQSKKTAGRQISVSPWEQKITDFLKVYEGTLKKINGFFEQRCGRMAAFYLRLAWQEAMKDCRPLWHSDSQTFTGITMLDILRDSPLRFPVMHQVRLVKNALNTLIIRLLISVKNVAGDTPLQELVDELNTALTVLRKKGNLNHQEAARDIPELFPLVADYPSWLARGTALMVQGQFDDAETMLSKIPAEHSERGQVQEYLERLKQMRLRSEKIDRLPGQIEDALLEDDLLKARQLLNLLQSDAPEHCGISSLTDHVRTRCDAAVEELWLPAWNPRFQTGFSPASHVASTLSAEEGYFLSRIDGMTGIRDLCAIGGMDRQNTICCLKHLITLGIVQPPPAKSAASPPEPRRTHEPSSIQRAMVDTTPGMPVTSVSARSVQPSLPATDTRTEAVHVAESGHDVAPPTTDRIERDTIPRVIIEDKTVPLEPVLTRRDRKSSAKPATLPRDIPVATPQAQRETLRTPVVDDDRRRTEREPERDAAPERPPEATSPQPGVVIPEKAAVVAPTTPPEQPTQRPKTDKERRKAEADLFFSKGLTAMRDENYTQAIDCFEKAIEHFSAGVAYYHYLDRAKLMAREQETLQLLNYIRQAVAANAWQQAEKAVRHALVMNQRHQELMSLAATIFMARKNYKDAERSLRSQIDMEPGNADHYVALGKLFVECRDLIKARQQFTLALQWNKKHPEARRQLNLLP